MLQNFGKMLQDLQMNHVSELLYLNELTPIQSLQESS